MQWNSLVENATGASVHVDLRGEMNTWRKVHWSMNRVTHFSSWSSQLSEIGRGLGARKEYHTLSVILLLPRYFLAVTTTGQKLTKWTLGLIKIQLYRKKKKQMGNLAEVSWFPAHVLYCFLYIHLTEVFILWCLLCYTLQRHFIWFSNWRCH